MICAGKTYGNTRLQNAVPLRDTLFNTVIDRPVQRMSHCSNKLPDRIAWQLCIGIQRNNVANVLKNGHSPSDSDKVIAGLAAQKRIQLLELAALTLVAHPQTLTRIPAAWPVQKEERIVLLAVFPV